MKLLNQIQNDMLAAMKAKESEKLGTLRMMKAALKKQEVDSMKPLDETTEIRILKMLVNQRKESIEMFQKGNRPELAAKEEAELRLIAAYLPAAATEEDLNNAVLESMKETGANNPKQMGLVMKTAQAKLAGRQIDGKMLSEKVKSALGS